MPDNTSKPTQGSTVPPKPSTPDKPPIITLKTVRITDSVDPAVVKATIHKDKSE
jgi:hypothetical protein